MMPTLFLYPLLGPRALGEGDRAALWRGRRLPGDTANQAPDHTTVARLPCSARVTYGATIARNRAAHRIVIFQDTLERDFGSDPDLLARQVDRTLRHAVAHHLGYNEPGSPRSASEADRAVARRGVEAWLRGVKVAYIFSTSGAMTRQVSLTSQSSEPGRRASGEVRSGPPSR